MVKNVINLNLWWGCSKVNSSCNNCYVKDTAKRLLKTDVFGDVKPRKIVKSVWSDLKQLNKRAKNSGEPIIVNIGGMMDIWEDPKPLVDLKEETVYLDLLKTKEQTTLDLVVDLFTEIALGKYDNLIFLFPTKRPRRLLKGIPKVYRDSLKDNVWFGVSVSDQKTANSLISALNKFAPASSKLFVNIEPQLQSIDLHNIEGIESVKWIVNGGEYGTDKRPFDLKWAYDLQNQCEALSIPYYFTQIDMIQAIPEDLKREYPTF